MKRFLLICVVVLIGCGAPSVADLEERFNEQDARLEIYKKLWVWGWDPSCDEEKSEFDNPHSRLNWRSIEFRNAGSDFELYVQAGEESRNTAVQILDEREALLDEIRGMLQQVECDVPF